MRGGRDGAGEGRGGGGTGRDEKSRKKLTHSGKSLCDSFRWFYLDGFTGLPFLDFSCGDSGVFCHLVQR